MKKTENHKKTNKKLLSRDKRKSIRNQARNKEFKNRIENIKLKINHWKS